MSLDQGLLRSASPASSEASLPRRRARGNDEGIKDDKAYRRYAASVERALSLFDTALQEWADYISFLSRLLKALQSHPPSLHVVPNKTVVAKRLAQCLNPSLPPGVHQKAIEVYSYIFVLLKPEGLARDLALYLPGIAPTLSFASLTVRPLFLSLVESHLVNLDPAAIRPALKAIILALLPGLEEETSDDFETTLRILNKFRNFGRNLSHNDQSESETDASGQYFWQCLFLASITNPSRRLGVLAYLNRHLPKLGGSEPWSVVSKKWQDSENSGLSAVAESVIKPDPGLLIRCFATGLADEQVLVQRNFLDLLVTHLPLHSPVLQRCITANDLEILVSTAAGVVTRRDMSLNRRLWAWFMGPESTSNGETEHGDGDVGVAPTGQATNLAFDSETSKSQYFGQFGLKPLTRGIRSMINQNSLHPPQRAKPFRISLSLMDRWEVGGLVVPAIFLSVMRSTKEYKQIAPSNGQFDEVFRSASSFFDGVESSLIFSELISLVHLEPSAINTRSNRAVNDLKLANFIVSHFNMREEEMLLIHIPFLLLALLVKLKAISNMMVEPENADIQTRALDETSFIANQLLDLIPERAFTNKNPMARSRGDVMKDQQGLNGETISRIILDFYKRSKESLELPPLPFSYLQLDTLLFRESLSLMLSAFEGEERKSHFKERAHLFMTLLSKMPKSESFRDEPLFKDMYCKLLSTAKLSGCDLPFSTISSITSLLTTLYSIHTTGFYITYGQLCDAVPYLVQRFWQFLSPSSPKFHVEAVRCLWLLHSVTWQDHLMEASIASIMIGADKSSKSSHVTTTDQAERFFVLWNHSHQLNIDLSPARNSKPDPSNNLNIADTKALYQSSMLDRPLFIVLDLLSEASNEASLVVKDWLQDLSSVHKIFRITLMKLSGLAYFDRRGSVNDLETDDANQCRYLFQTLSNVISRLSPVGWSAMKTNTVVDLKHHSSTEGDAPPPEQSVQEAIMHVCIWALSKTNDAAAPVSLEEERMQQSALSIIRQLLLGPGAENLVHLNIDSFLIDQLSSALDWNSDSLQPAMIDTLLAGLRNRFSHAVIERPPSGHLRKSSIEALSRLSFSADKTEEGLVPMAPRPPPQLLPCLLKGISMTTSHVIVEKWVILLAECLPLYMGTIFQILLTLVECFCKRIMKSYSELQLVFQKTDDPSQHRVEHVTVALLNGLENCIAMAHDRLLLEESNVSAPKSPDQPQGFFGNMVSGVFASEGNQTRTSTANNRLTVLLCFQDAVRLCFSIWSWGNTRHGGSSQDPESMASFQYSSLRMRNRSRRILEHLFTAEALDCLETLVQMWCKAAAADDAVETRLIFNLLHTLDGSRPKVTIPAIFNAIYSRTNPAALDPSRKSAMTSRLSEAELVAFLVTYARSLDDDVLDEIWSDCTTFLRDVLANPFPHRQILPRLMQFAAVLGEKMENTNFGDDRRARKELGDLLLRLLTAIFTSKSLGSAFDSPSSAKSAENQRAGIQHIVGPDDMVSILVSTMPALTSILGESDRISTAMASVSTNIVGPQVHSRLFPQNMNRSFLDLVQQMSKVQSASKLWRKDVGDAFNDPKFFSMKIGLVQTNWLSLLRQWVLTDKDRLPELLSRLTMPTSAGIMFGVGATAARLEADRKAQLNLRRIALLVLAANEDHFSTELPNVHQKLEDLLSATNVSSPSSATRAEIYMVLRSLVLNTSTIHLAQFWPMINSELHDIIPAIADRGQQSETYNPYSLLQACKLLETLLLLAPDDFQLQEWLFVSDTIDVVYPPEQWGSVALADEVAQGLGTSGTEENTNHHPLHDGNETSSSGDGFKKAWLNSELSRETAKDEIVEKVLRPFFDRLSIHTFESTYSMGAPDLTACRNDLLADLFNEFTMAS